MKALRFIIVCCLFPLLAQAQVQVTLNVNSNPNPKLADWMDHPEVGTLVITNSDPSLNGTQYKIQAKLTLNGQKVAETQITSMPVRNLEEGSEILQMDEIIPFNALHFFGNIKEDIITSGFLPPGHYLLCVSLINIDGLPLSTPARTCSSMLVTDYQMPELVFPKDITISKEILQGTLFTWSGVTPTPSTELGLKYIIAITEVQQGQSPAQAFSINRPIVEEEVENTTTFNWPVDIETEPNKRYVWSVKPVREDGTAYKTENDGFVAVASFKTRKERNPGLIDTKKEKDEDLCKCTKEIDMKFTLSAPDSTNIRKLKIDGIERLKTELLTNCNKKITPNNSKIDIQIGWLGEDKINQTTSDNVYTYAEDTTIPKKIFVRATTLPLNLNLGQRGVEHDNCEQVFYVAVPAKFREKKPKEGEIKFYSNYGGDEEFEFTAKKETLTQNGDKFSAKGWVYIEWLKARVAVAFKDIKLNSEKKIIAGNVVAIKYDEAPAYPLNWALEASSNTDWVNNSASEVASWVEDKIGRSIPYKSKADVSNYAKPVKMPLGLNFTENENQIAITEMRFTTEKPEFNFVAAVSVPQNWDTSVNGDTIGFVAKEVRFTPSSITGFKRAELIEDIAFKNTNEKIDFTFLKPKTKSNSESGGRGENVTSIPTTGCYLEWGESGFSNFGVQVACEFTREWLLPSDGDPNKKAKAILGAESVSDWNDLILTGSLTDAEIVGTNGMSIAANNMILDLSDTRNAANIQFPSVYEGDKSERFQGFYAKALKIVMPKTIMAGRNPLRIDVNDMIINDMGITLYASVEKEGDSGFGKVSIADLSANVNNANVKIKSSSLTEAGIGGTIKLPISSSAKFDYQANFHIAQANSQEENHLAIAITPPKEAIKADLFGANLKLDKTTSLNAYVSKEQQKFDLTINGSLSLVKEVEVGKIDFSLPALKVQDMKLKYERKKSGNTKKFTFNQGEWSFASPQKSIAGFSFSMQNVGFKNLSEVKEDDELFRGKITVGGKINLANTVGGSTSLGITGAIKDNFKPSYVGASIDKVNVEADLSVVNIKGELEFFNGDAIYGDGFHGAFGVKFTPLDLGAKADIYFGKKKIGANNPFRYWAVEADADVNVPFMGGLSFRRFGGGAYYNMQFNDAQTLAEDEHRFTPYKAEEGSTLGFIAKTTIATTAEESTFNADATLQAVINTSDGLQKIVFTGKLWAGGGLSAASRAEAYGKGTVDAEYDFTDNVFDLTADAEMKVSIIEAYANLHLNVDANNGLWFLHIGNHYSEDNLCEIKVKNVGEAYGYFMTGNTNVAPPRRGFTDKFRERYRTAMNKYPTNRTISTAPEVKTGAGFALGMGYGFNKHIEGEVETWWCFPDFDYEGNIGAGAELNLAFLNNGQCPGWNGWRAYGSVGVFGRADVTVLHVGFGVRGAAWVIGEFPNPTYAAGNITGEVKAFGKWWGIDVDFEYGKKCTGSGVNFFGNKSSLAPFFKSPSLVCRKFPNITMKDKTIFDFMEYVPNCETATEEQVCDSFYRAGQSFKKNSWLKMYYGVLVEMYREHLDGYNVFNKSECMECFRKQQENAASQALNDSDLDRDESAKIEKEFGNLITSISPENPTDYEFDNPINLKFKYTPNNPFVLRFIDETGSAVLKKYRLTYKVSAEKCEIDANGNGGGCGAVTLQSFVNGFGETCFYYKKGEIEKTLYTVGNVEFADMVAATEAINQVKKGTTQQNNTVVGAVRMPNVSRTTNATIANAYEVIAPIADNSTNVVSSATNDIVTTTEETWWGVDNAYYDITIRAEMQVYDKSTKNWKTISSNNPENTRTIRFKTKK